jgi:hypothetical protein
VIKKWRVLQRSPTIKDHYLLEMKDKRGERSGEEIQKEKKGFEQKT